MIQCENLLSSVCWCLLGKLGRGHRFSSAYSFSITLFRSSSQDWKSGGLTVESLSEDENCPVRAPQEEEDELCGPGLLKGPEL